ncbi:MULTISPECIES: amino acid ABC transporter permease [Variovorax]|jgi:polar amino acid transport system permease protein|uniref:amino acid ABC transporter permease n=1 Tax=Variovorax TaxID=34072 RepID=UPI00089CF08C|nr:MULTISPECIES: amino acid ABC transporter permease [unclassified Variovorax]SDW97663.1 amino acid ABC transporter membrane protein 2, PAAT family [Variovorax sp. YR634]SDZ47994.1 amino acid ABC transporter membrane protein 2, PAAT family [Variovorax sp. YR266]SOD28642.1 amino acid ABC transporter membrane protein 2, PAAT family [Variovorax sp. YR752]
MLDQILQELPRFFSYYNLLFFAKALGVTFALSAIGCVVGFSLGFLLAAVRLDTRPAGRPLRVASTVFIELFRRIPFLVTLMLVFFIFQGLNADLAMFTVALISVCLIATAFIAEIVRSGLESVHRNQWDAAAAMNFSYLQTLRLVIVPQAWKIILPPVFGFFVLFIKDTALASQIGVVELAFAGKTMNNKGFSATLVYGTVLALYFMLSYPLARFGKHLEKKLAPTRNR